MLALKPQDVLKMLREARNMPKNSSILSKFAEVDAFPFSCLPNHHLRT
jgi:pyrroline-5-carboxylate reductase